MKATIAVISSSPRTRCAGEAALKHAAHDLARDDHPGIDKGVSDLAPAPVGLGEAWRKTS